MKTPILLAFALAFTLPSLQATIIYGNLSALTNGGNNTQIEGTNGVGKAVGFTMGDTSYDLTSVTLRLFAAGDNALDKPLITLWTSDGNKPVAQVGDTFTNPVSYTPTVSTNYTFTPVAPITLDANQSYFVVVRGIDATTSFQWLAGTTSIPPTGVAATSGIYRFGLNTSVPNYTGSSSVLNWFQIDGTAISNIPEPSTYAALAGIAMLGLAFHRRPRSSDNIARIAN
jgi:hypothetical protein